MTAPPTDAATASVPETVPVPLSSEFPWTPVAPEAGPKFVLTTEGELYGRDTPENRELVRRIHACVAACEGITTAELEAGLVADMRRAITLVAPLLEAKVRTPAAA